MSTPPPPSRPTPPSRPLPPRPVIKNTTGRDLLIAVAIGLVVLALVGVGIATMSKLPGKPSTNLLTGIIVAKHNAGEREQEISVGKKGLTAKEIDSGYSFDVRTDPGGRIYEVPVPKVQYGMYEVGAKYSFIRPASEQR